MFDWVLNTPLYLRHTNNLTTFYSNMLYKLHILSGCLVEGGFIHFQMKLEFIVGDINLK